MNQPDLLALDFDGVICDGLQEYFLTAWKAHCQLWVPEERDVMLPPDGLAAAFYRLRPIVETGWEMPVVLHALRLGFTEAEILQDWSNLSLELLQQHQISPKQVGVIVDQIRDRWIATDLPGWLAKHQFYPGVINWLKSVDNFVIISTKEGRFIRQLLAQAGITLQDKQLFGKEQQRPKTAVLQELNQGDDRIWFVEDRINTLNKVIQHPELNNVELFLADWGYNLPAERQAVRSSDRIHLINLEQFTQGWENWQALVR